MSAGSLDAYDQLKENAYKIFLEQVVQQRADFSGLADRVNESDISEKLSVLFEATLLHQLTYQNDLTRNTRLSSNIMAYKDFFIREQLADASEAFTKAEQLHGIATVAISQASNAAGFAVMQAATAIASAKESSKRKL